MNIVNFQNFILNEENQKFYDLLAWGKVANSSKENSLCLITSLDMKTLYLKTMGSSSPRTILKSVEIKNNELVFDIERPSGIATRDFKPYLFEITAEKSLPLNYKIIYNGVEIELSNINLITLSDLFNSY